MVFIYFLIEFQILLEIVAALLNKLSKIFFTTTYKSIDYLYIILKEASWHFFLNS